MSLLLTVLATLALGLALVAAGVRRLLTRLDHHCTVRTLATGCARCDAVRRGEDRGGHLVCACGVTGPHLEGAALLEFRAAHLGEELPAPALAPYQSPEDALRTPDDSPAETPAETPAELTGETTAELPELPELPAQRSTTRGRAAAEAEERVRRQVEEEERLVEHRMIHRARRNPDPISPQLLKEAQEYGMRPVPAPADPADDAAGTADDAGTARARTGADRPTDPEPRDAS